MRLILLAMTLFFGIPEARAIIFGEDDRIDVSDASPLAQQLAKSAPALIHQNNLTQTSTGFQLKGQSLLGIGFCSDEKFYQETQIANCSASLISPRYVLTAAHCLDKAEYACEKYKVVFDYVKDVSYVDKEQVYGCKKVIYHEFDPWMLGLDLAVIELDRVVKDREPVKLNYKPKNGDSLFMIGYPYGISQKVTANGKVTGVKAESNHSFMHDLDTISVNSGGPIFNDTGEQVGVLVRASGANFLLDEKSGCQRWTYADETDFAEANDLSSLKATMKKIRMNR